MGWSLLHGLRMASLAVALAVASAPQSGNASPGHCGNCPPTVGSHDLSPSMPSMTAAHDNGTAAIGSHTADGMSCGDLSCGWPDNGDCAASHCPPATANLGAPSLAQAAGRLLRDVFFSMQHSLLAHDLVPEHGPPRA